MATETINTEASGRNTQTTVDAKRTIVTNCMQTDGTTSNGRVTTTIQTSGSGASLVVRMNTSDSTYAPDDKSDCIELIEFAEDMAAHWVEVKTQLEAMATDPGSDSD